MKGGDKMKNKIVLSLAGISTVATGLLTAVVVRAADYSASTTAAITDAGETVVGMFFDNLPVILGFVIAIILTMWGVNWVLSHFRRGRR